MAIDLDVGRSPIQGSLRPHGGPSRPFCGWLELTAALDALATVPGGEELGDEQKEHDR